MGSNASKLSRPGGRVLRTSNAQPLSPSVVQTKSTRPSQSAQIDDKQKKSDNLTVAERLLKLGQAQVSHETQHKYKPASEDVFTMTLEARQKLEQDYNDALENQEANAPRKNIPAVTITAVLNSIKEGDPIERVIKAYNLDPSVLDYLKAVSVPEIPKHNLPNELLQSSGAQRQPVRRKRNSPT